ncbi:MAG: SixA phosphatase family protein [Dichotomicrobium sp.]
MRTVSLYRHAKSSWDDPSLEDFDRGLSKRGQRSAPAMGAFLRESGLRPDTVLCSPAQRARETFALSFGEGGDAPDLHADERLYHASAATMLDLLRSQPAEVQHVMILGHNPGLHALALDLFSQGAPEAVDAICRKFPTCGLAVVDIELADWRGLCVGDGYLRLFITPKMLPADANAPA